MRSTPALSARDGLARLAGYPYAILTWVNGDGYPVSVAIHAAIDIGAGSAAFTGPAGLTLPTDRDVSLTGSHIRPQPGFGYDERRHVTVWGRVAADPAGLDRFILRGTRAWGWDEAETPFFEYSERAVGQSRRYFDALTAERGTPVRPRLSFGWLTLRATRLPFLSATFVPVLIGIAIAASHDRFDLPTALLTVLGAAFVHLGINVSNDVFDATLGADDVNVTPTQYSGGSRVIQYGLVSLPRMAAISALFFAAAAVVGLTLMALRGSQALLAIGVLGFVLGIGYTAPPLKLVYRGLGEIAVAVGFGPLMLLGAYVVQTRGALSWEALAASVPVAVLVALILYVNEIPDRRGDAHAGKRTLPVRLSPAAVVRLYEVSIAAAFASVVVSVALGALPVTALVILLAIPLALRVRDGLAPNYDNPYGLMAIMGVNIRLHLVVGVLLLVAYAAVLVAGAVAPGLPLFLR
ncbi:MAG TPA: prenyltransferase [Candidatus Limnocylindrales bacterium]|jgi:1,4-dihydroxy-2-naphthoate octaprenyltransferase